MAKDSPWWDLREGPLTEGLSMSDSNPCSFLVLINLLSNLPDVYIIKDCCLEQVQTEEVIEALAGIWSAFGWGYECYSLSWSVSANLGRRVSTHNLEFYFIHYFLLSLHPIHYHLDPLCRTYSCVCSPEWWGRWIKKLWITNQGRDCKNGKWSRDMT